MHASVRLQTPDGRIVELVHGEFVGRAWTSALRFDDGRISEAHALVSLRGGELMLLALRGVFSVGGTRRQAVALRRDLVIRLAEDIEVRVVEVTLPATVLALEGDGLGRQVLSGVCSLVADPRPSLQRGWARGRAVRFWPSDDGWTVEEHGGSPRPLQPGDVVALAGSSFRAVAVSLADGQADATHCTGALRAPLRLHAHFDTAHIHREGRPPVLLSGLSARLVSELVAMGGPVPWDVLAQELWPGVHKRALLRRRLDVTLNRLRRRLQQGGVRRDLVRSDGAGSIELLLEPHDAVLDAT
jgi:pSer/pThr/pTyr-binding forkhead associated (FHA) protein